MKNNLLIKNQRGFIFFKFIFEFIASVLALILPLFIKNVVDHQHLGELHYFWAFLFIYTLTSFVRSLFHMAVTRQKYKLMENLQNNMFKKLTHLPLPQVSKFKSGEMVELFSTDIKRISDYYFDTFPDIILSLIRTVSVIVIVLYLDLVLSLSILLILLTMVALLTPILKYTARFSELEYQHNTALTGFLSEVLRRIPLMKSSTGEWIEQHRAKEHFYTLHTHTKKSSVINTLLSPLIGGIILVFLGSIIVFIALRVSLGGMSGGTLTAYIMYILNVIVATLSLIFRIKDVSNQKQSIHRLKELIDTPSENLTEGKDLDKIESLIFSNVSFSYTDQKELLKNITLEIIKGESVAIVGASGAGKTTILSLIEGFYTPTQGKILINGHDFESYSLSSIRENISYVAQDYLAIGQSIRENLMYGLNPALTDTELLQTLSRYSCFDFIATLENGLDYTISDSIGNLSGGQLQRLAIARAYLKNSDLWLLDEITANLDAMSEKAIVDLINTLKQEKIIITVAHRLSTVVHSDKIIVLENGEITGIGKHEELLLTHPFYQQLVEHQFIKK